MQALELTQEIFKRKARARELRDVLFSETHTVSIPRRYPQRWSRLGRGLFSWEGRFQNFTFCQSYFPGGSLSWLSVAGHAFSRENRDQDLLATARSLSGSSAISAPVPGKVVKILIEPGARVEERQVVLILESMKMEFEVQATRSGQIGSVLVQPGQQVQADEQLVAWEAGPPTP